MSLQPEICFNAQIYSGVRKFDHQTVGCHDVYHAYDTNNSSLWLVILVLQLQFAFVR